MEKTVQEAYVYENGIILEIDRVVSAEIESPTEFDIKKLKEIGFKIVDCRNTNK